MEQTTQFAWIDFYSRFADVLLTYENDRQTLIEKIKMAYHTIRIKLPRFEANNEIYDLDPFTIFGMFNKGISDKNRIAIIGEFARVFGIDSKIPSTFGGIPVMNNQLANFFGFKDERGEKDIDNLWQLFRAAIRNADDPTESNKSEFTDAYDLALKLKGIKWNITMGLFWIRPYYYVNLDSRNRSFIGDRFHKWEESIGMLKKVPDGEAYIRICDFIRNALQTGDYPYHNFPELSSAAWFATKETEEDNKIISKAAFLRWFNPILKALKDLSGSATPKEVRAQIVKNEQLSENEISQTRGINQVNKFENEVAFARSYLVSAGYMDGSEHGVWTITESGRIVEMTDDLASQIFQDRVEEMKKNRERAEDSLLKKDEKTVRYWIYSPGFASVEWDDFYSTGIMAIPWDKIGDLGKYPDKEEMRHALQEQYGGDLTYKHTAHCTWQFAHEMKIGDIVIAKRGQHSVIGRGVVTSDYEFHPDRADEYKNQRKVQWSDKGEWEHPGPAVTKMLTDITPYTDYVDKLITLFEGETLEDIEEVEVVYSPYSPEDFLRDVYLSEERYHILTSLLKKKKNLILQGAPGVGKTYTAKRLAYSMMGVKDFSRVKMIQFHQNYSYEDFIMGFRPTLNGFELKKGPFYSFCKKAEIDSDNDYYFIIDEINRGNLSKILGELMLLIESDKRGIELQLLYSDEKFSVPTNVFIIGMMNTADRSLAILDYALRRRFGFFDFRPAFEEEGFVRYQKSKENAKFDQLIEMVKMLNIEIENDDSLGGGFCIGHSYFCSDDDIDDLWLSSLIEHELLPLIKEYWFDEPDKIYEWNRKLHEALK